MPTLQAFTSVISEIQQWFKNKSSYSEAVVSQCVVLRLLEAAGFDIWNPQKVIPQGTSEIGKRPDFLVHSDNQSFILEVKAARITFTAKEYSQAGNDAIDNNTRWAILTNGHIWSAIDLEANNKPFREREVLRIEWNDNTEIVARELYALLCRQHWEDGKVEQSIEQIKKERQEREIIEYYDPRIRAFADELTMRDVTKAIHFFFKQEKEKDGAQPKTTWKNDEDVISKHLKAEQAKESKAKEDKEEDKEATSPQTQAPEPQTAEEAKEVFILFQIEHHEGIAYARYYPQAPEKKAWVLLKESQLSTSDREYNKTKSKRPQYQPLIAKIDGKLTLTEDIPALSASGAAGLVLGGAQDGWVVWKDSSEPAKTAQHYRTKNPSP